MADDWPSQKAVQGGDIVGRRLFGSSPVIAASDVPMDAFDDTRVHMDLSFDRLGNGSVQKSVVRHLTPQCDEEAEKRKTEFNGWAALEAKKYKKVEFKPDALTKEKDGYENPFHALLIRDSARNKQQAFHLSRSLFLHFLTGDGKIVQPERSSRSSGLAS
jgi:hypothetical protein